jgi:hypothetical protein
MGEFRYMRADEWGMTWTRPPVAEKLLDPECFVHHSAGGHSDDAVTAFRALNAYAQAPKPNGKGYSALDYDVLVHRNPKTGLVTIGEGRGPWLSAATADRNEQGEAVCVLGYFHPGHTLSRQPHPDEIEGTARAIVWGIEQGWVARDARILGHRDNPAHPGATGCPGDYLYVYMPAIRARVAELLAPPQEAPTMSALAAPVRLMDTRPLPGDRLPAGTIVPVAAATPRPEWARSVVVNITATNIEGDGFVTAWADGPMPLTSNLSLRNAEAAISNLALVPLAADGTFKVSNQAAGCDLVIDQQGWAG